MLKNKLPILHRTTIFILLVLGTGVIIMVHHGVLHPLLEAAYKEKAPTFFNEMIAGRHVKPLRHYQVLLNAMVHQGTLCFWVLCIFFLLPPKLKIVAVTLAIIFLVLEVSTHAYSHYLTNNYPTRLGREHLLWMHDPELGWRKAPNQDTEFIVRKAHLRTKVKTNSRGLRDAEYAYEKPPHIRRILLLGDSFVVGLEVDEDKVLDRRMEYYLAQDGEYQVINGGTRGYGTDQSFLFLKQEGYQWEPDIVIYFFVHNDPENNTTIHRPGRKFGKPYFIADQNGALSITGIPVPTKFKPYYRWMMSNSRVEEAYNRQRDKQAKRNRVFRSSTLGKVDLMLSQFEFLKWALRRIKRVEGLEERFPWVNNLGGHDVIWRNLKGMPDWVPEAQWQLTDLIVRDMAKYVNDLGVPFLIYEVAHYSTVHRTSTRLEVICKKYEIPYANAFEKLNQMPNGYQTLRFKHDTHWTSEGHDFTAKEVVEILRKRDFV